MTYRILAAAALAGTALAPLHAQSASGADQAGDTIIVTATLRAANVQDVPIAVTAVSPVELERQGINDIKNLGQVSPSFNIQSSQTETQGTSIKIRGVGTTGNNTGLESSVGIFIDGVYQSRPGVALGDLLDLERVEVLRGPQGTLFGRNTSAGALNISTRRPDLSAFEGFANATYGNYNFMNLQAGVSVPIIQDQLGIRVSGAWRKRDGYLNSATGAESNNRDRWLVRGQALWEPSDNISLRIIADYAKTDENCCDAVIITDTDLVARGAYTAYGLPANGGVPNSGPSAYRNLRTNAEEFVNNSEQWGISGELKVGLGDFADLTYIGAYRSFRGESLQESDFTGLQLFSVGPGSTDTRGQDLAYDDIKTQSHELRVQGTLFADRLDWLVGAYYSKEDIISRAAMTLGRDFQRGAGTAFFTAIGTALGSNPLYALTAAGNGGVPVDANGSYADNRFEQNGSSWSLFTHNVFEIVDGVSLTAGLRYTEEKKDGRFDQLSASSPACVAIANGVAAGTIPAGLRAGALGLTCFPFATQANLPLSAVLPLPRTFDKTFKDDEFTYTLQASWKPTDDIMVYASFAHGFKSGGFNLDPTAAVLGADPRFASEKTDAWELGAKTEWFNGLLRANLALFQMELSGFQVLEFTGVQFVTFNVDKVKAQGFELETFGNLAPGLTANFALTYSDARYPDDCSDAADPEPARRLCGNDLTNAPKWTSVFGFTYDGGIGSSDWGFLANLNVRYESSRRTSTQAIESVANPTPLALDIQKANMKVNARVGVSTGNLSFELWGTNLTDERTRGITSSTPLRGRANNASTGVTNGRSRTAFIEEPRMYGVTARFKF
jgi:outer membrane receptor protein involved in Fe transport